jgi:hypothetical protein
MLDRIAVLAGFPLVLACMGCTSPSPEHDADWQPEKIYRTGSNIPAKDYGAANIEIGRPDVAAPMNRPGTSVLGRKPGN